MAAVILVAGGTGRLGSVLIPMLTARGEAVRVLTRDPRRTESLTGVQVAVGDVRRPADVQRAADGVASIVSAVHGFAGPGRVTPASVDRDGNANIVGAAESVGAEVVLMSVVGAAADHPMELFRMKAAAEERLRMSRVPWTIVRSGAFVELYAELMCRTAGRSGRPLVFGRGTNPIRFAAVRDVAEAVDAALDDRSMRGQVVEVAGPSLTFNELAASLEPELGSRAHRPQHVPRGVLRCLAVTKTAAGRRAHAALVMDTRAMA